MRTASKTTLHRCCAVLSRLLQLLSSVPNLPQPRPQSVVKCRLCVRELQHANNVSTLQRGRIFTTQQAITTGACST